MIEIKFKNNSGSMTLHDSWGEAISKAWDKSLHHGFGLILTTPKFAIYLEMEDLEKIPEIVEKMMNEDLEKETEDADKCPDCGKPTDDLHTCIEYERNRADELERKYGLLVIETMLLKNRIEILEREKLAQTPWRKA